MLVYLSKSSREKGQFFFLFRVRPSFIVGEYFEYDNGQLVVLAAEVITLQENRRIPMEGFVRNSSGKAISDEKSSVSNSEAVLKIVNV